MERDCWICGETMAIGIDYDRTNPFVSFRCDCGTHAVASNEIQRAYKNREITGLTRHKEA